MFNVVLLVSIIISLLVACTQFLQCSISGSTKEKERRKEGRKQKTSFEQLPPPAAAGIESKESIRRAKGHAPLLKVLFKNETGSICADL